GQPPRLMVLRLAAPPSRVRLHLRLPGTLARRGTPTPRRIRLHAYRRELDPGRTPPTRRRGGARAGDRTPAWRVADDPLARPLHRTDWRAGSSLAHPRPPALGFRARCTRDAGAHGGLHRMVPVRLPVRRNAPALAAGRAPGRHLLGRVLRRG